MEMMVFVRAMGGLGGDGGILNEENEEMGMEVVGREI